MQTNIETLLKDNNIIKESNNLFNKINSFGINANTENHAFFSVISHNIKNPFSTLLGFSDLLFEDFDELNNEERKFYLNEIKKSANFTYQYIEKFFQWIYYKTGKMKLEFEPIKIHTAIEKIANKLNNNYNSKISIINNVTENLTVYADFDSFEKIINNLIDNAIKFTNSTPEITITAKTHNNKIEISIKDKGIGISEEDIVKLFNIAIDPSGIGGNGNKGVGLGLILTKELITLNNGTISVESNINEGSRFSFVLPNMEYLDY